MSARGFAGYGLIKRFPNGLVFFVEEGLLTADGQPVLSVGPLVASNSEVWSFSTPLKTPFPLDTRVYAEGLLSGTKLEASYIEPRPKVMLSTSTPLDATIPSMDVITLHRDEYEIEKHAEFKLGLMFGLQIAVGLLTKWAAQKFLDGKDAEAVALRYAAGLLREERYTQAFKNYETRPYVEQVEKSRPYIEQAQK